MQFTFLNSIKNQLLICPAWIFISTISYLQFNMERIVVTVVHYLSIY